jgi:hypothetical protein
MALTQVQPGMLASDSQFSGFKNRIINGAMVIDQRNAGASVTPTNGQYTLDRWQATLNAASKYTVQQNAGSVTPPAGFTNYLGVTSSSAYSVPAGEIFTLVQPIEGFNTADLAWGTASASTVTLSFWVRSSLTGTFGGALQNAAGNRSYPFSYTISSANTWEYETITIAGDTTGTWVGATNGMGISLNLGLGVGSNFSATAGAWIGANRQSSTGAVSVLGTNGATLYITGVQLEKGSTATSFDYRPYGTELALCQRYFETSFVGGVSTTNTDQNGIISFAGFSGATTTSFMGVVAVQYRVSKRATPTITTYDFASPRNSGALHRFQLGVSGNNNQNATVGDNGYIGFNIYSTGTAGCSGIAFHYTSSAEL